ncbi:polysaccharide deacetylase family protein [Bacillus sp. DTU_2020_1000418_1_SI_GHA_SEK_038]|uniref:polysaccharide deacetylase family protein n=1 Tax=Bacillus sp. DTU_2020_1000418_1_SI_GHA_SEK_038 TaxID=3077585 RepID=UPI0028E5BCE0|nr:polysaccharide deacetylase family protein [Bacillus sp. DTU_2020_1000418_1_SI_GHA_SEK_038]WNS77222.1 polysaccharide deacetylase family protein [Bacillus sp. DTU_2020_1000418_1_SI_GHA_SEK_038]
MKKWIYLSIIVIVAFFFVNNPLTNQYITGLKADSISVSKQNDPLYREITARAADYYIPPQDAKIDRIWKAMPGLNGLQVDIVASYKKMKPDGEFKEERLVFKQVQPKVQLNDLPPSPTYKGHPEKEMVSFIINVAWGNEYLTDVLATLKKHNVSASFFLEGKWAQNNPELAKMIEEAGHEIGNHSYSQPNMAKISTSKMREEIQKTNDVLKAITDKPVKWFAPPSGSFRDETVQIASQESLRTVIWSVDTVDLKKPSPEELLNRVMSKVHNGAIILMHPTSPTERSLDQLIIGLKKQDFQIGTVSELLSSDRKADNLNFGKVNSKENNN